MKRRKILQTFGVGLLGWPFSLFAQQARPTPGTRRVGVLAPSTPANEDVILKPFYDGMRDLGWLEGRNIAYERVYAENEHARLPSLALELVRRNPEVIFAPPGPAALAASKATRSIPIVFSLAIDPVGMGLVASLARPGGNVTGVVDAFDSVAPKRIEILKELIPATARVGVVFDPTDPVAVQEVRALRDSNARLAVTLIDAGVRNAKELDSVVRQLLEKAPDAVYTTGALIFNHRRRVLELAGVRRIPVIGSSLPAEEGALFSYGFSLAERIRRAAYFVDRILKGARPGDLAVEQISKLELVINAKIAKELGVRIPQSVLLRADRQIQ